MENTELQYKDFKFGKVIPYQFIQPLLMTNSENQENISSTPILKELLLS